MAISCTSEECCFLHNTLSWRGHYIRVLLLGVTQLISMLKEYQRLAILSILGSVSRWICQTKMMQHKYQISKIKPSSLTCISSQPLQTVLSLFCFWNLSSSRKKNSVYFNHANNSNITIIGLTIHTLEYTGGKVPVCSGFTKRKRSSQILRYVSSFLAKPSTGILWVLSPTHYKKKIIILHPQQLPLGS